MNPPQLLVEAVRRSGVRDPAVLRAIAAVPRERFLPEAARDQAWEDLPIPLPGGQAVSQPSAAARMIEIAGVRSGSRVLEVGTGSGWQGAVLSALGAEVSTVELDPGLHAEASRLLAELAPRVALRLGDGRAGWAERAPFDAILVGGATGRIPQELLDQLATGGTLVFPSGGGRLQELVSLRHEPGGRLVRRGHGAVAYQRLAEPGPI